MMSSREWPIWALCTRSLSANTVQRAAIGVGFCEVRAMRPKSSTSTPSRLAWEDKKDPVPAAQRVFMA